jgi:hypothetical protein
MRLASLELSFLSSLMGQTKFSVLEEKGDPIRACYIVHVAFIWRAKGLVWVLFGACGVDLLFARSAFKGPQIKNFFLIFAPMKSGVL